MLVLNNVNKYYKTVNNFHALKNIDLTVTKGEFLAVLGESGSGKSTLLNVVSGLDTYESGDITIGGISTENFTKREWAIYRNNYVGFIFQEYNLVDHLSVVENVELPLLLQGVSPKEARQRALEKCQLLGLKNHVHKVPKKVSGGQQQRAAIARALVTEPEVILADEPTGALDSENAKIILDILKALSKDHVVILVTHDEENAKEYANRIVTLEDGRIINDTKEDVTTKITSKKETIEFKSPNMKLKVLWKFAKNNMGKRKLRTLFTSLTMAIGLISIFLITFLINGIRTEITDFVSELIPEDQYFVKSEVNQALVSYEDLDLIRGKDKVNEAFFPTRIHPLIESEDINPENPNVPTKGYVQNSTFLYSIPVHKKNFSRKNDLVGDYPKNEREVIVTSRVAEQIIGFKVKEDDLDQALDEIKDDLIEVDQISADETLDESFKIVGIVFDQQSSTVFTLHTKLEQYVNDFGNGAEYEQYTNIHVDRSKLNVFLNTEDKDEIEVFKDELADEGLVLRNPSNMVNGSIDQFFDTLLYILLGTASVSLLVAGILVGLMVYISVVERIKEIGILTSIGARRANIQSLFIFESGFIGFLSAIIALVLSLLISMLINNIFNQTIGSLMRTLNLGDMEEFKLLHIDWLAILIVFGISIGFAIVSGLIPAIRASGLKAVEALRQE
ncbi:ABC transporter ATP-binding protein/permease [Haloplasma contractile]|uniref:Macrolide transport system ATP-binding-permease protein n=1 Tax=Haloplasma contractile SSD-17B TaxID=1033810 RepID=F7PVY6_9MOLU|nr:ABC transporter ATP-binding protein/permease [Haloplasma contractile]ERJ12690.1 macrolide transport system ATP-binding-permease protein [Haloplasma contractile SSD-17B]